jgi:teichuronic acid biosynthesis glycosyltransferase TuaG
VSTGLVSVLTTTYNGERFVGEAIESVLSQTYGEVEEIVVDDASEDGTREIIREYARRDERVRVLEFDERRGPTRRRNDALAAARGSYLAWLDHDDLFLPRKLELQVAALEGDPGAGFAYGQFERFDHDTGEVLERSALRPDGELLRRLYLEGCFIASSTVTIRRAALERRGLRFRDTHASFGDDHFLWLGLALDWRALLVDEVVTRVRMHDANESTRLGRENTTLWSVHLLEEFARTYPDAAAKLGSARRRGIARHCALAAGYELRRGHRARAAELALRAATGTPVDAFRYAVDRTRGRLRRSLARESHSAR